MSTADTISLLSKLGITDVVISTPNANDISTPIANKQIAKEVKEIATEAVENLDEKITQTYTDSTNTHDTIGEAFAKGDTPWKN